MRAPPNALPYLAALAWPAALAAALAVGCRHLSEDSGGYYPAAAPPGQGPDGRLVPVPAPTTDDGSLNVLQVLPAR